MPGSKEALRRSGLSTPTRVANHEQFSATSRSHHGISPGNRMPVRSSARPRLPGATAGLPRPPHSFYFDGVALYLREGATVAAGKSGPNGRKSRMTHYGLLAPENDTLCRIG